MKPKRKLQLAAAFFLLAALVAALLLWLRLQRQPELPQPATVVAGSSPEQLDQMATAHHPASSSLRFELDETNSKRMIGRDDPENERWADIAGNFYSSDFARGFSYEDKSETGPCVRVRIKPAGKTLSGRLEAHGLKPNFAYQVKVMGDFADRRGFELIGYRGRWRLPGRGTNYSDWDYQAYENKEDIEAYILFDFLVTDDRGDAILDFALEQSLHVLWNVTRQGVIIREPNIRKHDLRADNPATYARPKEAATVEYVYGEPEAARYTGAPVRLPEGRYSASLVLTEESFHSYGRDDGYWASPLRLPLEFYIVGGK